MLQNLINELYPYSFKTSCVNQPKRYVTLTLKGLNILKQDLYNSIYHKSFEFEKYRSRFRFI